MKKLFGTDGIRGTANQYPIIPDLIQKIGMVAGHFFQKPGHKNRVVIAKDTRLSGYMIEQAISSGFLSVGFDVIMVGPVPTPAVSFLIKSLRADLGVMISASHNPYHDNGIKIFDPEGYKLSDEVEAQLEKEILSSDITKFIVPSDAIGRAKRLDDAPGRYIEHVKRSFPKGLDLTGLRVVIDCANGAAYHLAPTILWELGAEVFKIGVDPDGLNINQNCGAMHPEALAAKVVETRADIGIALDGDADRVVIVDEKGKTVHGDHLMAMVAIKLLSDNMLATNDIVVTQMTNLALDKYLSSYDINVHRVQIGDRYVSQKMRQLGANFGGEQSGHLVFSDFSKTGDGIIAALQVLSLLVASKKPISTLAHPFDLNPQVVKSIKFNKANPLESDKVINSLKEIESREADCKVLVRKSGTENLIRIMIEGADALKINELASEIAGMLSGGQISDCA